LSRVATISDFEAVVLTDASVAAGTAFTFNPAANTLVQGSATVSISADEISFGGLVRELAIGTGYVANVSSGVSVTVAGATAATVHGGAGADTITGSTGNDVFRGGAGNDTLNGGAGLGEKVVITLAGGSAVLDGAGPEVLTITGDGGNTLTIQADDGVVVAVTDLELVTGTADGDQIGALIASQTTAFLAAQLGYAAGSIQSVAYNSTNNELTIQFTEAAGNVTNVTTGVTAGSTMSAPVAVTPGITNGSDTFVFGATAAANGADTINNYSNGALIGGGDVLNFSAFLGGAATLADLNGGAAGSAADFATGGALTNGQVGVFFNKATLSATDVQLAAAAGKISLADNAKAVVLVTADVDGVADATVNAYQVYYIQDTNTGAGQTYSVTLVGTLNSTTELNAVDFTAPNLP